MPSFRIYAYKLLAMETLRENWLTEGLIDFEFKQYQLLGYLQKVKQSFKQVELYPSLGDLVFHYRNLKSISENKGLIRENFPKEISLENIKNLELTYKKIVDDDAVMRELEDIINFAMPKVKESLDEGSFIYEYVESQCEIAPVGLASLYSQEGYLFLLQPPQTEVEMFRYTVTIFSQSHESMRGVHTQHIGTAPRSISHTLENKKLELMRKFTDLPNPSTYLITSKLKFPFAQTLMPVAKRILVKHISKAA
jgi:hypothetical protein